MATVSEAVACLGVDPDKVKAWARDFAEYFGPTVQPTKGRERKFSQADLRVLAAVAEHLEVRNDADDVHDALNRRRQFAGPVVGLVRLHTPLFHEQPAGMDDTWRHGTMTGGMACRGLVQVARAYKLAADGLLAQALAKHEPLNGYQKRTRLACG